MSDHEEQLRWNGQLGANPNPPCQHSLWEETRVPTENPRLSVEEGSKRPSFACILQVPESLSIRSFLTINVSVENPVSFIYIWSRKLVAQSEASFVLTAHTKTIKRDWN